MTDLVKYALDGVSGGTTITTGVFGTGDTTPAVVTGTAPTAHDSGDRIPRVRYEQAASTASYIRFNHTSSTQLGGRFYFEYSAAPSAVQGVLAHIGGGVQRLRHSLRPDGSWQMHGASGAAYNISGEALAPNTIYRIEYVATLTSSGGFTVNIFLGETETMVTSITQSGINFGSGADQLWLGATIASVTMPVFYIDDLHLTDEATAPGAVDPPVDPPPDPDPEDLVIYSLDGVGDGVTVSTSTAGTGDTAPSLVTGTAPVTENSGSRHPRLKYTQVAATASYLRFSHTSGTQFAGRFYVEFDGFPASTAGIAAHVGSGTLRLRHSIRSDGHWQMHGVGGAAYNTSDNALSINTIYRVEWTAELVDPGGFTVNIYEGETDTLTATITQTGISFAGPADQLWLGAVNTTPTMPVFYYDDVLVTNQDVPPGAIDPPQYYVVRAWDGTQWIDAVDVRAWDGTQWVSAIDIRVFGVSDNWDPDQVFDHTVFDPGVFN